MSPTAGALATVIMLDAEDELLWVRFANGNAGFLDPDAGPDVEIGATLLVSLEDGSFIEAPDEIFPKAAETGALATVVLVTPDEAYWVRYVHGDYGPLHRDGGPDVAVGAVILVTGSKFTPAPDGIIPPIKTNIGVVRRVEKSRTLVETEHSFQWIEHDGAADWQEWSTVELSDTEILREISSAPLRYRDDPPAKTTIHSRFKVDPASITETFDDIAGLDGQIEELRQIIEMMHDAETLKKKGFLPIRGLLLAGESGTGKTMLARALANEANATFFHVRGPEIASKWVNESEEMLRALMDEADGLEHAVVFFDEIDSLGSARSSSAHEMSNKLITQFLALLDGFDKSPGRALIVGATNRPDALDPTMLRSGRFDRRIDFKLPTLDERAAILQSTKPDELPDGIDVNRLAAQTEFWCSADLRSLWTSAFQFAQSEHRKLILELDCEIAIERITPLVSARRAQLGRAK